ncbi:DUF4189 domain-containing protein [Calothrix sp. 336/3]|uniref:DUF4189 domain-containing protein n=1 Tax=Calothrix sp. 336/3 TaxID=1337936 RepID=UPI00055147EC|nr:DUF4189 domain-containing protein [Calothrix sp. 336/3]AKG22898.1 hypothetical protein IJ00_17905 [Calothrix sp. 336/3]
MSLQSLEKIGRKIALLTVIAYPTLGFNNIQPAAAQPRDNYGAIAYSRQTRANGTSWNFATRDAAERAAVRECERYSGSGDCQSMIWFRNACAALAEADNGALGWAWNRDRGPAEREAVRQCFRYRGDNCKVIRWTCTDR